MNAAGRHYATQKSGGKFLVVDLMDRTWVYHRFDTEAQADTVAWMMDNGMDAETALYTFEDIFFNTI